MGFTYSTPVTLHQGRGCIKENGAFFAASGGRAFVLTGTFAGNCRNIALDDVKDALGGEGISYAVCGRVEENPSVESVAAIADEIRDFAPDFIVAIGGGSALDTAKAANVLIRAPKGADALETLYGGVPAAAGSRSMGLLPLFGVPTTAGSGSEAAGYAILTRRDLGTKLRMGTVIVVIMTMLFPGLA